MTPQSFPPTVPRYGNPFPPLGPLGGFPGFIGPTSCSDFRAPVAHHFVAFAQRYRLAAGVCGSPRFLGDPRMHALLSDPGGNVVPGLVRHAVGVFRCFDGVGFHHSLISGLNHTAYMPAVYASQP